MSLPWKSRSYHLRIFVLCLGMVFIALLAVLFGVRMEAISHATGVVQVRDTQEIRAPFTGLVELGWYEGEIIPSDTPVRVRLDRQGNGTTGPGQGPLRKVQNFCCPEGGNLTFDQLRFHKLQAGDHVWSGQVVAFLRADELLGQMQRWKARLEDLQARKETNRETLVRFQTLRDVLAQGSLLAPGEGLAWKVLKVACSQGQKVQAGDLLAILAPINSTTSQPHDWIAQLDILEKHAAGVEPGQEVRLYSTMFNHRLHGHAEGRVEKIEPLAEPGPHGNERYFRAQVKITPGAFPLHPGTTVKAEIVLGLKRVYRIILEQ